MVTVLELPLDWRPPPGLRLEPLPLTPAPIDVDAWRAGLLGHDLPAGAELRRRATARDGAMTLDDADVVTPDGRVVEARLLATYDFAGHAGAALARARPDQLPAMRGEILAILAAARPAFIDVSLALCDLLPP